MLVNGINHLAMVTRDLDRMIDFYHRVFAAEVRLDMTEDGLRHAFIQVGSNVILHPFELPDAVPEPPQPMFNRGVLDHFGLTAATEGEFYETRRRALDAGATDGIVRDFGPLIQFNFQDPDGGDYEVWLFKPDADLADVLPRREWQLVNT
jgi:catechol 2,3-dioxygenase-like lactoylglutathione lyase family enzyme